MKMKYKAIVFDMDGTLVDSEHLHIGAWFKMFQEFGITMSHEELMQYVGVSDVNICKDLTTRFSLTYSAEEILDQKRYYYRHHEQKNVKLIAGVEDGLQNLNPNLPMAVATMSSKYEAEKSLDYTGIRKYFLEVVTADDVSRHKPDPECYLMACAAIGMRPEDCIAVEDSVSGVHAAKNAGLYTIGVANTVHASEILHADLVLKDSIAVFKTISTMLEV